MRPRQHCHHSMRTPCLYVYRRPRKLSRLFDPGCFALSWARSEKAEKPAIYPEIRLSNPSVISTWVTGTVDRQRGIVYIETSIYPLPGNTEDKFESPLQCSVYGLLHLIRFGVEPHSPPWEFLSGIHLRTKSSSSDSSSICGPPCNQSLAILISHPPFRAHWQGAHVAALPR